MYWLGLFIAVASVPGYTSASIPAGWAAMSIALPATLWRNAQWTFLHSLFLAFIGFACLSFAWTPSPLDGGFRLWQLILIFLAFRLGSSIDGPTQIISGLALGCAISSLLSVAQWLGWNPVLSYSDGSGTPGLFFNPSVAGQVLALVAVACLAFGLWWHTLLLLPGIYLSGSRGGWIVLIAGLLLAVFPFRKLFLLIAIGILFLVTISVTTSDLERLLIWKGTIINLTWFGQGIGSFNLLYMLMDANFVRPEHAHNDPLQLIFEFGPAAGFLFIIAWACLTQHDSIEWPIFAAFIILGLAAFPFFTPISAFLAALCAGRLACDWDRARASLPIRRYAFALWNPHPKHSSDKLGSEPVPIQLRTS